MGIFRAAVQTVGVWGASLALSMGALLSSGTAAGRPGTVTFDPSADTVPAYEPLEVTVRVAQPDAKNPFTDATVQGHFALAGQADALQVQGFCDSPDGSLYRIRFMPSRPGAYAYSVIYRQGGFERTHSGHFSASEGHRRGLLRVDPAYPWHFVWEGTGKHVFLNGTTAFFLMGWDNDATIRSTLDRLHRFKVNRVRVLLNGRSDHFWTEPIRPGNGFRAAMNPWVAQRPEDTANPGYDYARFNLAHWQKVERMLRYARDLDLNVSLIMDWNDTAVHPAAGSDDEHRYYRYAAARLGAFSNITWDLGDDLDGFRDEAWTHATGTLLMQWDVYHHLATSHPVNNEHQDRTAPWFGMTSFQQWPRPLHAWMLSQRAIQAKTGRIIPQVNEEYGYEDHYPDWSPIPAPGCCADANRRAAWEMAMAGTYQTTGETAKRGTGVAPDTGGGWVNGRGDDTMILLREQVPMVDFFTGFDWWKTEPHDELVDHDAFCLAEPGSLYAVYLPHGGSVTVKLEAGSYRAGCLSPLFPSP